MWGWSGGPLGVVPPRVLKTRAIRYPRGVSARLPRLCSPAFVAALVLVGCGQVGHAIDEALFNLGLLIFGTFGLLGLWGLVATIRGPRVGAFTLVMSLLLGAIVVAFTVDGTSGLDPSPGTISRGAAILMWLPQTLAFAAVVTAARFAADRLPGARARVAWYAAAAILAIYVGLLVRATTRVIVPPLQGRVAAVAVGASESYGLSDAGELLVMPRLALPGRFQAVRAAEGPALAIDTEGRLHEVSGWRPTAPLAAPTGVQDLALAGRHACAVDGGGRLHCRTRRGEGPSPSFLELRSFRDVVDVEVSEARVCAIDRAGAVACGRFDAQRGPEADQTAEPLALRDARGLALTLTRTCAVTTGAEVACVEEAPGGPVRPGTPAPALEPPTAVPGLRGVVEIVAGDYHFCARDGAGAVRCWGGNGWNQLGPDTLGEAHTEPVSVALPAPAARLFGHRTSTCASLQDGRLFCWGAQARTGGLLFGERCGRVLGPWNYCASRPDEVTLPTTAIPLPPASARDRRGPARSVAHSDDP